MAQNLRELFEHELRDLYDAEKKLVRATGAMANKVGHPELKRALKEHQKVTEGQATRLERVFAVAGIRPRRESCKGIEGLIEEFRHFTQEEKPAKPVLDVFALGAALKVEHYEMTAYRSLLKLAPQIGLTGAVDLLQQTLTEEEQTAERLERLSDAVGKPAAMLGDGSSPARGSAGRKKTTSARGAKRATPSKTRGAKRSSAGSRAGKSASKRATKRK